VGIPFGREEDIEGGEARDAEAEVEGEGGEGGNVWMVVAEG